MKNKRFYNFTGVIYEDDENFATQMFNITQEKQSLWIRHDQDIYDTDVFEKDGVTIKYSAGDTKKPHYHFVTHLKTACTISALAKRFDMEENMIEPIKKSLNGALRYLIHYGYENKYQYSADEVKGNSDDFKRKFDDLVSKDTPEVDKVISIQEFIESCNDFVDMAILGRYVQKLNKWDAFRRNYSYFRDIVNSHNAKISAMKYGIQDSYYDSHWTN